jgi:hypothetical protein
METQQKDLQQIARQKMQATTPPVNAPVVAPSPAPAQAPASVSISEFERVSALPPNHILNITKTMKERRTRQTVWFDFALPSNGRCGYPKDIKLRELTTEDEKILIKEMFASKENSLLNVIAKCAKFEGVENFNWENLTVFDQDYILIALSTITFPGKKDIQITDDAGHKVTVELKKEDLSLTQLSTDAEYPFKVELPETKFNWYLKFTTLKMLKEIDKQMQALPDDMLTRLLMSIAHATDKIVTTDGNEVKFDNYFEVIKLLDTLPTSDLKVIIDYFNDKTTAAYGYKLQKEYYCATCVKGGTIELEPLTFFRITI